MARKRAPKAKKPPSSRKKRALRRKPVAPAPAPSEKQRYLDTLSREYATTLKVLRGLPSDHVDFRPHPRAKSARELAWVFVMEQMLVSRAIMDELNILSGGPPPAPPQHYSAILDQFVRDHEALVELVRDTPESRLGSVFKFPTGPGQVGDWTKMAFAWFILADQIHHRGQFSVYVRMAGGRVPSIYGPSGDEPWR